MKLREFFYISNILSFARIVLIIPIYFLLAMDKMFANYLAVLVMLVAALTDSLDGRLARRLNQKSDIGRILDPIADKISVFIVALMLVRLRDLPFWFFAVVVGRDVAIVLFGILLAFKTKVVVESNKIGKVTVTALAVVMVVFTLQIELVKWPFLWITVGLLAISSVSYFLKMLEIIRSNKKFA